MPIIQAFQGSYTVAGRSRSDEKLSIYEETVIAYGRTIGELLDNLVEASVTLANRTMEWVLVNKGADYKLKDDFWHVSIMHPDIRNSLIANADNAEDLDIGGGSSLDSFEHIVNYAVLNREISIASTLSYAKIVSRGSVSELPSEPEKAYTGCYQAPTLREMTTYGWNGKELDNILQIAVREERLPANDDFLIGGKVSNVTPKKRRSFWTR